MQEERKRRTLVGHGDGGVPSWLDMLLWAIESPDRDRLRRRLIRMLKILKARSPWYDGNNEYNDSVQRERLREDRKELWMMRLWMQKAQAENLALAMRSRNQQQEIDALRARLPPGLNT